MQNLSEIQHLSQEEVIKNGSIFTPIHLVELVQKMLKSYITESSILADFGSGYGAFLNVFQDKGKRCFATEIDPFSVDVIKKEFPKIEVFEENSLRSISRKKYNLQEEDELIIIGNPPYNDITSIYKKGEKGKIESDEDVKSRDFGKSFLKAFDKLHASYICVLHPLAYLIKKTNFDSLGEFKNHYQLLEATIFSSREFDGIKKSKEEFPVIAGLYKLNPMGMDYEYIRNFKFKILNSEKIFYLKNIKTIDGIVQKYPKKQKINKLQFYTLRDMNALQRNKGFIDGVVTNGLDVSLENLYQYAWLYFLKNNFDSQNKFLYANLSPLWTDRLEDAVFVNCVVSYAYNHCPLIDKYYSKEIIEERYGSIIDKYDDLYEELNRLIAY